MWSNIFQLFMWRDIFQAAKKVMTCVMGEGEDGVPDAVAHIDVEHPEVKLCFDFLSVNEPKLHNSVGEVCAYFQ